MHTSLEKLFDPRSIFMGLLDSLKELSAKLLHIVLLERFSVSPLEAFEEIASIGWLIFGLKVDEQLLELIGDAIFFWDFFGIMP